MNSPDWRDRPTWPRRPTTAHFGPASWQASLLALLSAIFVRPVLAILTIIGLIVNRVRPEAMQRARLDVIDKPFRVIPALPDTEVTQVALPHCSAEWVVAPAARGSERVQVWHKAMHMFQLSFDVNPDARHAVDEIAAFIRHATTLQDEVSA